MRINHHHPPLKVDPNNDDFVDFVRVLKFIILSTI